MRWAIGTGMTAPLLDILVLDEGGQPVRPWFTTVIDDHSRAIAGYLVFLGSPSALNTSLALRHAIWRKADPAWPICGIPDLLYVDHGSETSAARAQIHGLLERAIDDLPASFRLVFVMCDVE